MRAALIAAVIALAVVLLYRATIAQAPWECEACLAYQGQQACGKVAAQDRDEAVRRAISHACSVLASGVTASLDCERTPPDSLTCSER